MITFMSSIRANILRSITSAYLRRVDVANIDLVSRRRLLNRVARIFPIARGVDKQTDTVAGLASEWLLPKGCRQDRILLYLHGGGYVLGGCDMHRQFVSHLARASGLKALLPEYRLAPEHKYPAAIDDAVRVYESLLASGIGADQIALGGDSAGGGLCVATLLTLRARGLPMPRTAVLLSPFLDVTASGESMQTRAELDPWFKAESVSIVADHYCEKHQQQDPRVSPVFADLKGLPPLFVQVGDHEILLSDSVRLRDKVAAAGGQIELEIWPEMWHVFQMFVRKMPESQSAIQGIGEYLKQSFA